MSHGINLSTENIISSGSLANVLRTPRFSGHRLQRKAHSRSHGIHKSLKSHLPSAASCGLCCDTQAAQLPGCTAVYSQCSLDLFSAQLTLSCPYWATSCGVFPTLPHFPFKIWPISLYSCRTYFFFLSVYMSLWFLFLTSYIQRRWASCVSRFLYPRMPDS